ncbi:unnamed protein product [Prunus armeniaca]
MSVSSYKWAFGTKWYKHGMGRADKLVGKTRTKPVEAELDERDRALFIYCKFLFSHASGEGFSLTRKSGA